MWIHKRNRMFGFWSNFKVLRVPRHKYNIMLVVYLFCCFSEKKTKMDVKNRRVWWPSPDRPTVSRKKRETRLHARTALPLPVSLSFSYRALYHTRLFRHFYRGMDGPNMPQFHGCYVTFIHHPLFSTCGSHVSLTVVWMIHWLLWITIWRRNLRDKTKQEIATNWMIHSVQKYI